MDVNDKLKIISDNYFSFSEISMSAYYIENNIVFSTEDTSKDGCETTDLVLLRLKQIRAEDKRDREDRMRQLVSDILSSISTLQEVIVDIYFNYDCSSYRYRLSYYLKQLPRWKHLIEIGIPTPKNYPGNSASDYTVTSFTDFDETKYSVCMQWFYDVQPILVHMKTNLDELRTWLFDPEQPWYRSDSEIIDHKYRESYYVVQRLKLKPEEIREKIDDYADYLYQKEGLPYHLFKPPEIYGRPVYIPPSEAKPDGPRYGTPRYNGRNEDTLIPPDRSTRGFSRGEFHHNDNDNTEPTNDKSSCERPPNNPFRHEDIRYRRDYMPLNRPSFRFGGVRQDGNSSARSSADPKRCMQSAAQKYGMFQRDIEKKESEMKSTEKKSDKTKPSEKKPVTKPTISNNRFSSLLGSDEE